MPMQYLLNFVIHLELAASDDMIHCYCFLFVYLILYTILVMFSFYLYCCWNYCSTHDYCYYYCCSMGNIDHCMFSIDHFLRQQNTWKMIKAEKTIISFHIQWDVDFYFLLHTMDIQNLANNRMDNQIYSNNPMHQLHLHQFHTNRNQLQDFYYKQHQFDRPFLIQWSDSMYFHLFCVFVVVHIHCTVHHFKYLIMIESY